MTNVINFLLQADWSKGCYQMVQDDVRNNRSNLIRENSIVPGFVKSGFILDIAFYKLKESKLAREKAAESSQPGPSQVGADQPGPSRARSSQEGHCWKQIC